ncbi:MAG: ABC transporter ATP-binding protein [Gemmatimonadales bacterium]
MSNAAETKDLGYSPGGKFRIEALNLHVPAGAIYGFLGPNGSGKTTTLRLLLGLLRPRSGSITVLGHAMPAASAEVLARVGYVPEAPHFDGTRSIRDLLRFQAAFYPTWDWAAAEALLKQFDLDAARPFGRLSKGQRAKVLMLSAMAQRPELLVLDEPTDGLDPVARRDILASLLDYVAERQATVIISSHLVHELERICDWVGVMDNGRLITEVPMTRLKNGTKKLKVSGAGEQAPAGLPFVLMAREAHGRRETWTVRNWEPAMSEWFGGNGIALEEVVDLDLEDGFVELLRTFRGTGLRDSMDKGD